MDTLEKFIAASIDLIANSALISLFVIGGLVLLGSCSNPQPISTSPVKDVLAAAPLGGTVQQGLLDAEWNLDQAVALKILPATDPADRCLHEGLTMMGLEPAPAGTTSPAAPTSFTPKESDLISTGAVLYIRLQQAKALGLGGSIALPTDCKAIIGGFVLDAAAAGKNLQPGGSILPTIQ